MDLSVIQEGEIENEFDIHVCCAECSADRYGWKEHQHNLIKSHLRDKKPLPVPYHVKNVEQFKEYVKTL